MWGCEASSGGGGGKDAISWALEAARLASSCMFTYIGWVEPVTETHINLNDWTHLLLRSSDGSIIRFTPLEKLNSQENNEIEKNRSGVRDEPEEVNLRHEIQFVAARTM